MNYDHEFHILTCPWRNGRNRASQNLLPGGGLLEVP